MKPLNCLIQLHIIRIKVGRLVKSFLNFFRLPRSIFAYVCFAIAAACSGLYIKPISQAALRLCDYGD